MANQPMINAISGNYKILKVLGQGCYGQVVKCFKRDTKETVAVKVLKRRYSQYRDKREVSMLEKLRCLDPDKSNIVRCHEWFHRIDRTFMVFEMLDMSLHEYMYQRKLFPLPLNGIRTIIKDVATALNAMKGVGLIHTDLKPDNIMLVNHQIKPFRVKLIDFGLTLETFEAWPGRGVQPLWQRSPEVILGLPFTEAIDVWSLGSVLAQMLLGFPLFPGVHEYDVLRFIIDLLGEPPKRLLNGGINTQLFYYGSCNYLLFMHWTLMTPKEFHSETGIKPIETRRYRFSSLDYLKTLSSHKANSAEAAESSACVELLKEMLQMDPRNRITSKQILEHPFITRSYLSTSFQNKTQLAADTSKRQVVSDKYTAETKADDRCPIEQLAGVIRVLPAQKTMQRIEATKQSSSTSLQAVQNKTNCQKAEDDRRDYILEPVSDKTNDNGLVLESFTDSVETSPSVDRDIVSIPSVDPNSCVEAPDSVLSQSSNSINSLLKLEIRKPKKKIKKGIQGFLSTLKSKLFACFCVPEDADE